MKSARPSMSRRCCVQAAALETYRGIIVTECATSATRITAIVQRCAGAVGELHGLVKRLHARLEEWAKESYHGECRAVSNTAATLMGAIEGTRAIPAALSVTGRDFQAAALRCTAVVSVAAEITARPGVANGMARASDVAAAILAVSERFPGGGLPPIWAEAGREKIVAALRMLAYSGAAACERGQKDEEDPMLDWRVVLVSMLKSAFPALRDVEEDVLKYTLDKMKGADADADGMLTRDEFMGVEMWFEKSAEGLAILVSGPPAWRPCR